MRQILNKFFGIVLSTSLVFTGLSLSSTAFAEEPEPKQRIEEETLEESNYASILDTQVISETATTVTIEVKTDQNIEDTDAPIAIYEEDEPIALAEENNGGKSIKFTVEKTEQPQYIHATTGNNVGETISVSPILNETGTFELNADRYILENDQSAPQLSWQLNDAENSYDYNLFVVDSKDRIIHSVSNYYNDSRTFIIDPFYDVEDMSYTVYIAENDITSTSLSDLTNIKYISNTITIYREQWNIQASMNFEEYTSEDELFLDWTSNELPDDYYSMYLVDKDTGNILQTINNYPSTTEDGIHSFLLRVEDPYDEQTRNYIIYAAKRDEDATNVSQLQDIRAISNVASTKHTPFQLQSSADKTTFYTYDDTPQIFWNINQALSRTNYDLYFVNEDTGLIKSVEWMYDTNGSFEIDRFWFGDEPHRYKLYIAKTGLGSGDHTSEMTDIVEESEIFEITRVKWKVSASVVPAEGGYNKIVWSANQPNNHSDFTAYLINSDNGEILYEDNFYEPAGEIDRLRPVDSTFWYEQYFRGNYKIVIAERHLWDDEITHPTNYSELKKIEAESDVINNLPEPKPYIKLSYVSTDTAGRYKFTVNTTNVYYGSDYSSYVVQDSNGKIVRRYSDSESSYSFNLNINNPAETYTAYVADRNDSATNLSQLTNIKATSQGIYPRFAPSKNDYKPNAGRSRGGFNPSDPNCNQQCYGDPINNFTGEYFESSDDLTVSARSPLSVVRSYSTLQKDVLGPFGLGSTANYNMKLIGDLDNLEDSENIRVVQENSSIIDFVRTTDGKFKGSADTQVELVYENDQYTLTRKSGETFAFDNFGNLITISDLFGNTSTLTYTDGKVSKITADDGKFINIIYNTDDLITSVTDGIREVSYAYDSQKRLTRVQSYKAENPTEYAYDSLNRVIEITQPNGGKYTNTFNAANKVTKQVDPMGKATSFVYTTTDEYYETKTTLPNGSIYIDRYDLFGRLIKETLDVNGQNLVFEYTYNSSGQISITTDSNNDEKEYMYDERGNITTFIDEAGRATRYTYNERNQVVEKVDPLGNKTIQQYDENGALTQSTDANGGITKYETDDYGRLLSTTLPEEIDKPSPKSSEIVYDNNGFISQNISPKGHAQSIVNNSIGLPLTITDPMSNATNIEYDTHLNLIKTIYPNGTFEEYEYDTSGRLTKSIDELGNETTYTYDLMDNVKTVTTPFGTTTYTYDALQNLTKVVEPNGNTTQYAYNKLGQKTKITNTLGDVSTIEYDEKGNVSAQSDFKGNFTYYNYDEVGNLKYVEDADGNYTNYFYDRLNQLKEIHTPGGYVEKYEYDKVGNIVKLNKNNIDKTSYIYNKNNQLTKTTYSNRSSEDKTYDADGNLTSFTNRDGKTNSYVYNANGQVMETVRPDSIEELIKYDSMGSISEISYDNWSTIDTKYDYNNLGQLTKATKNGVETTYSYDAIGQLTSRGPPSAQVGYSYDTYGKLNDLSYPNGVSVQYTYDQLNNIDKVLLNGTETIVEYGYDKNSNVIEETYGNGVVRTQQYDVLNRLTNINLHNLTTSLYDRSIEYNSKSLITGINTLQDNTITEDKTLYYDSLNKISSVSDSTNSTYEGYELDNFSNILEAPFGKNTITKNGQLISTETNDVVYNYTFDERGNRTSKTNGVNNSAFEYEWSNDNKLQNLTITNVNGSTTALDYLYDTSGLLTSRSKNNVKTDDYVWDTNSSIPLLLEDDTNSYIYGNDTTPIAQIDKHTDEIHYLHGDERGSIVLATDDTGNSVLTRVYDTYGNHTDESIINPSNGLPNDFTTNFAYAGEYQDKDTGLYNLRARWYEPSTGSFINQDPALLLTGEAYSYASGNPLSFTDPLGLYSMGITPSDNKWGNIAAGFVDGLIGYPVVHKVSNYIKPGSVSNCGPGYKYAEYAGFGAGFLIPGGAAVKGTTMAVKGASKGASTLGKISKADDGLETVLRHGKTKERIDTTGIPRFNAQDPAFGEAAKHNADVLQGQKWLLQREYGPTKEARRKQISSNRYNNTKQLKGRKVGYEKDEVPPASTTASRAHDSSVRFILKEDNREHGKALLAFYNEHNINPGDWFIYE